MRISQLTPHPSRRKTEEGPVEVKNYTVQGLKFLQANVRRPWPRLIALQDYGKSLGICPTFLAIQDPPLDLHESSWKLGDYHTVSLGDWPRVDVENTPVFTDGKQEYAARRVAFCVHRSIPSSAWSVNWDEGKNRHYVVSLRLQILGDEEIVVYNLYNRIPRRTIDFTELLNQATEGNCIIHGDFNFHHKMWHKNCKRHTDPDAKLLAYRTKMAGMVCANQESRIPTFKADGKETTIDLVFFGTKHQAPLGRFQGRETSVV
ncbi:reverse transcriptase [Colletotrichum sojae]|uniref:Reverse transcriptase n=1 Tax=Colletotrichum sojae TaxID=2175907 RepID=A0A8H6IKM3_9PEZI|nr:reverse transcriptase [Colletotrichum sojae]